MATDLASVRGTQRIIVGTTAFRLKRMFIVGLRAANGFGHRSISCVLAVCLAFKSPFDLKFMKIVA